MITSRKIFVLIMLAAITHGLYAIRMYEKNGDVVVKMNVPDAHADNIRVRIENGNLHISSKREQKKEVSGQNYYEKEIEQGSFDRMISLPSGIDTNAMDWEVKGGTLTVMIPKIEE